MERFPLGEYLQDEMNERGWSVDDVVVRMGRDPAIDSFCLETLLAAAILPRDNVLNQVFLDIETAGVLAKAFGVNAVTLLNIDHAYRNGRTT